MLSFFRDFLQVENVEENVAILPISAYFVDSLASRYVMKCVTG
jgi:hypothetical protein